MKVLLLFLFLNPNHEPIGAQLFPGFFPNVQTCEAMAERVVAENPKPDGVDVVKYRCFTASATTDNEKATKL